MLIQSYLTFNQSFRFTKKSLNYKGGEYISNMYPPSYDSESSFFLYADDHDRLPTRCKICGTLLYNTTFKFCPIECKVSN